MALTDYSDLEQEIKDAPEPKNLPAGTETKVRIIDVRQGTSEKNDCDYLMPVFEVPDDPMVIEFSDFFWAPTPDNRERLTDKQYSRNLYSLKQFFTAFNIDYSRPFDWDSDVVGLEGWVIVGIRKSDEYGPQNTVKKYITPR